MPDYGHDLEFGTFITPQSQRPQDVVALAQLTERAGLDLATFQDHPYQAGFLDTWTLLSWVAAQTETLRVAPNVLNLPLRQPAVLARAAASLDLLSDGRVELGLGAGAFWDAIAAMGGPRRSPGESVEALEEAIAILRAAWTEQSVTVRGDHYQVAGFRPGPPPAHPIGIWIGAYKPRMLRLTGRLGDGWLPSLGNTTPAALSEMQQRIDDAAVQAGRDPRAIRRLLNVSGTITAGPAQELLQGPPAHWVEALTELAAEQGFDGFVFWATAGDTLEQIERFAADVVPGVRAATA